MTDPIPARNLPYHDARLPVKTRVSDLLSRLDTEDKVGLMFQSMTLMGDPSAELSVMGLPSLEQMVLQRRMTHFNVVGSPGSGRDFATWNNRVQKLARGTGWGIPVTLSTDPRHGFTDNPAAAMAAGPFSQWPETLGLAATRSAALVQQFADIARQEYVAAGIRVALHPQVDLATEPRWARIVGTFGEDADLTSDLAAAYIRGFQTPTLGPSSVSTMTKHFPGGGPQKDGEDAHFPYGREQVYPGHNFDYHLRPFVAAIATGTAQMMPYYGMPIGTEYEQVGFGFNKSVITGLLRERLGFDGIVCTDWSIVTDSIVQGERIDARAWGVEHLTPSERLRMIVDAGADQVGGEFCTHLLVELVRSGQLTEERIDQSATRLLREKFVLGLFDDPFVDEDRAEAVIGNTSFKDAGLAAQRASLTVLTTSRTGPAALPLRRGLRVYTEGLTDTTLTGYAVIVTDPADADVAIVRIQAPYDPRTGGVAPYFHAGSLEFSPDTLTRLRALADTVPTVVDVYLDRPALLAPITGLATTVLVDYGASDDAVLDVLFGVTSAHGKLPFDIPSTPEAVIAQASDVPFDSANPLFRFGHGLDIPATNQGRDTDA
ncbi:glycoside hydrolase family 3 N-terminal domain-containing protein [Glaciihabitans sp. UYNi722]|uniref:glycoside hydrolase family 3 protein n=1 Tax=Glaciihabitans sp. UYNi722 TaxID=3156344 RepID=UPI003399563E